MLNRKRSEGRAAAWTRQPYILSPEARAAIKLLSLLARRGRIAQGEIARLWLLGEGDAAALLGRLLRHGLLARLDRGAYGLAQPAAAISIARIVRIVDGPGYSSPCASANGAFCRDCREFEICAVQEVLARMGSAANEILGNISLAEAAE